MSAPTRRSLPHRPWALGQSPRWLSTSHWSPDRSNTSSPRSLRRITGDLLAAPKLGAAAGAYQAVNSIRNG